MIKGLFALAVACVLFAAPAFAANPKGYQVTGPVVELTNDKIVVQKGKSNWELKRDASTKLPEGVKVGSKVTIQYAMTATDVEVKEAKAPKAKTEKAAGTTKAKTESKTKTK